MENLPSPSQLNAMPPSRSRPTSAAGLFVTAASLSLGTLTSLNAWAGGVPAGGPLEPGHARPPLHFNATPSTSVYYSPAQIRHAYGIDQLTATGAGQTIAIVDAYGSSSVQKDLDTFCAYFGIPTTTVATYYPQGKPAPNSGWAQETELDVEWAHAIAPGAKIVLVAAKTASFNNLLGAVDYAVNNLGATVVSMSWGGSEFSGETSYDYHFNHNGVTFVASSGDNGESTGVEWPAASPFVVSVGGTSLYLDGSNNRSAETAWSGSGGGISQYEKLPSYQSGWLNTGGRGVPDVSLVADPNTGVEVVYGGRLYVFGGTSVGAPQWAGLVAIANSMRSPGTGTLNSPNTALYSLAMTGGGYTVNPNNFFDISSGNNGSDPDDYSVPAYDLVTGVGSPVASGLVTALSLK